MKNFLRDRRVRGRISQAELAKELGVSQQTVARWETSGQIPAKYLKDLAVTLGARVKDFLPGAAPATDVPDVAKDGAATEAADDFPFGDIFISYLGEAKPRRYPVTGSTMDQIQEALGDVGCGADKSEPWVRFETLNNKWVAINTSHIERLAFVDDNVEEMTPAVHVEVYKAARDLHAQMPDEAEAGAHDFRYSKKMLADVDGLLESLGEHAIFELGGVTCEYTSGFVTRSLLSHDSAMALDYAFNAGDPSDLRPESFLTLHDPDNGTTEHVRLGALRSIEVSLLAFNEATE